MENNQTAFLTAYWKYLAMLNYEVDPKILLSRLPTGTELDIFEGKTFVSMVGFLFHDTKVLRIPIPFHQDFEEINLRFYVRHKAKNGEWRRGVVFVKEIVPKFAIAFVARAIYEEHYISIPTRHTLEFDENQNPKLVTYEWEYEDKWHSLSVKPTGQPYILKPGSEEEFIAEHYWGYTRHSDASTTEYKVEHPPWKVWSVKESTFDCDIAGLYGSEFNEFLKVKPSSAFLAEGSNVTVYMGNKLD
jgi:uncharacterized protein